MSAATRVFVGWDRLPMRAFEDALAERRDLASEALVALPGRRSGRVLGLQLARRLGPGFSPPHIVTLGRLIDELVKLPGPVAPRLVRTLAWQQALRALGGGLRAMTSNIPAADDHRAWAGLAATVRTLHGELGAEGRDFASVQADAEIAERPTELARWRALAQAHEHFTALLGREGLLDPHDARRQAIAAGEFDPSRDVVLAGCVELSGLQRSLLESLGEHVTALVPAPLEEASAFDELGGLDVAHWYERTLPVELAHWRVVGEPADQAAAVTDWLAELGGSRSPAEVTIGVLDDEVKPLLSRRLGRHGLVARDAAGQPASGTGPARVIACVGAYLESRTFPRLADLVRLPEIEAWVARECGLGAHAPAALLDCYHAEHLPGRLGGDWLEDDPLGAAKRAGAAERCRRIHRCVRELLSDLDGVRERRLGEWMPPLRSLLEQLYRGADLAADGRSGRTLAEELAAIGPCLSELEAVPEAMSPRLGARDAFGVLRDELESSVLAPLAGDMLTIDVLGWLELAFDDAPALAITGLAEGRVPASTEGDAFLPDRLRARLGLVDDRRRLARDVCLLAIILASRPETRLVSAHRDASRNPLAPSRLLLRAPADDVAERVLHAFAPPPPRAHAGRMAGATHVLPRAATETGDGTVQLDSMPVTSFKLWLESPYRFYIERLLRLEGVDDDAPELGAPLFGTVVHAVLATLGQSELTECDEKGPIERFLHAELDAYAQKRFGRDALPSVQLQLLQTGRRLSLFADAQALRAADGWRIEQTEWRPEEAVVLDVDGTPLRLTGRIDRIDRHQDGRLAIIDYKTSNSKPKWASVYDDARGQWRDLQLPLYRLLAATLEPRIVGGENVEFEYFCVGKDAASTGTVDEITAKRSERWSGERLAQADEQARDIVRRIRAHELFTVGQWVPTDPPAAGLVGAGIVGLEDDPDPLASVLAGDSPPEAAVAAGRRAAETGGPLP